MFIRLGAVSVQLKSDSEAVRAGWQRLFGGMPQGLVGGAPLAQATFMLRLVNALSPPPGELIYRDSQKIVDVYRENSGDALALHFRQGAVIHTSPSHSGELQGQVTPPIFRHGRLEDVTLTALAPLLRRHSCYLLHAAGVTTDRGAVLLVGPSHSGKTTTGLALVLSGYRHLASDAVVLAHLDGRIAAFPTVGTPRVRAHSLRLLPALNQLADDNVDGLSDSAGVRIQIRPEQWSPAMPVAAIIFPRISSASRSSLQRLEKSVALARLMEESIDRWDSQAMLQHIEFLTALSKQVQLYRLALAPDIENLPQLIEEAL